MAKDISDVVVLNNSLAISVNINKVILKMSETFRFKAMNVYKLKFSANKLLAQSYSM